MYGIKRRRGFKNPMRLAQGKLKRREEERPWERNLYQQLQDLNAGILDV